MRFKVKDSSLGKLGLELGISLRQDLTSGPNLKELVSIIVGHDRLHVRQAKNSLEEISPQVFGTARTLNLGT